MKIHLAFILVLIAVLANGCKEDGTDIVTPPLDYPISFNCDFDVGNYDLLPSSLSYSPYNGKSSVFFSDSIGTSLKLKITKNGPIHIKGVMIKYDVFTPGDTVRYCYSSEQLRFFLVDDSKNIQLSPTITANPFYPQPEPGIQYDYFEVWYTLPQVDPFHSAQVFAAIIDIRTAQEIYFGTNTHLASYEVFGHMYNDVEKTNFSNPPSTVYFNRTEGIVSFTDGDGKTWRFDHFQ